MRSSTVLELGAGTGLLAMGLTGSGSAAGCSRVFAVEGDDQVLDNLRLNVQTNHCSSSVLPVFWNWEETMTVPPEIPLEELDLIIGSDIVFGKYYAESELARALCTMLYDQRAREGLHALLLLADRACDASGSSYVYVEQFLQACHKQSLVVQELALSVD